MSSPAPGKGKNKRKSKGRGDRGRGRANHGQEQLRTPGRSGGAAKYPDEKEVFSQEKREGTICPVLKETTVPDQSSSSAEEKPASGPSRPSTSKENVPAEQKPEEKPQSFTKEGELEKAEPSHPASSKGKKPAKGGKTKQQPAPSQGKQPSSSPAGTKGIFK